MNIADIVPLAAIITAIGSVLGVVFLAVRNRRQDKQVAKRNSFEALWRIVDELQEQNEKLDSRTSGLTAENDALRIRVLALETENSALRIRVLTLESENIALRSSIVDLKAQNADLKEQMRNVQREPDG